jgi:hypothetical protein
MQRPYPLMLALIRPRCMPPALARSSPAAAVVLDSRHHCSCPIISHIIAHCIDTQLLWPPCAACSVRMHCRGRTTRAHRFVLSSHRFAVSNSRAHNSTCPTTCTHAHTSYRRTGQTKSISTCTEDERRDAHSRACACSACVCRECGAASAPLLAGAHPSLSTRSTITHSATYVLTVTCRFICTAMCAGLRLECHRECSSRPPPRCSRCAASPRPTRVCAHSTCARHSELRAPPLRLHRVKHRSRSARSGCVCLGGRRVQR